MSRTCIMSGTVLWRPAFCSLIVATLAGSATRAADSMEAQVEVLGHVVLPETSMDGFTVGEVSGLEWSDAEGILYGVTDRGVLLTFDLEFDRTRLGGVTPVSARALLNAGGQAVDEDVFNPEALEIETVGGATRLLVASETGPAAAIFDVAGNWISEAALPEATLVSEASGSNGIESVALHPNYGVLMAAEEPTDRADPRIHTIFTSSGCAFSYSAADIGESRLKAMEVLEDGRILILERVKGAEEDSLIPYVRVLDPASCDTGGLCPTQIARIDLPGIPDADYEGLADLGGGLLLIASDDKIKGDLRTVFALLQLPL